MSSREITYQTPGYDLRKGFVIVTHGERFTIASVRIDGNYTTVKFQGAPSLTIRTTDTLTVVSDN